MRKYRKVLLLGCLCGILCVFSDMVNMEEISLSQIILRTTFSQTWYHAGFIMSIMKMFIPLLLFQILCGSMIYRYFCCASVYYFTRNASRRKWFLLECAKLYLTCLSFLIIMILTGAAALLLVGKVTIDSSVVWIGGYYLLIYSLYLFGFTLGINVLSLAWNSTAGIAVPAIIQIMGIAFYTMMSQFADPVTGYLAADRAWMVYINPFAQLAFGIHTRNGKPVFSIFGPQEFPFELNMSVAYVGIIAIFAVAAGCAAVNRHEFITNDKEIE